MKYILAIIVAGVLLAAGALWYAWSGAYDIGATRPHWPVTLSFIEILKDRSIEAHSKGIQTPNLDDSKLREASFPHYHEMCRLCHGAPGESTEEFATGLYPAPPSMASGHIQAELSPAEIYWVVKHGIKMTGMPAFGPTHSEDILWGLTSLAKEMPRMSPDAYRQQVKAAGAAEGMGHGHAHGGSEAEAAPGHGGHEHQEHREGAEAHH